MDWFLIALLAPLFWAISNFLDKTLITKYFKGGVGTMIVYSSLIGFPIALLILVFNPTVLQIAPITAILVILNSFLFILFLFPYLFALNKADTSSVVPLFQLVPVITYFLAFFLLGETLSKNSIIASLVIIIGAIGISAKSYDKKIFSGAVLFPMILSSLLVSLSYLFFKFFALQIDFWQTSFWQYCGILIFGLLLLLFVKNYRKDFVSSFRKNKGKIISLNLLNEVVNISAVMIFTFATLLAPIALVWTVNGFQPLFVFLIGLIFTVFFPKIIKEDVRGKALIRKIVFIIILFIGSYLLQASL